MSTRRWNVAQAKARLSEVIDETRRGPQVIEKRGREVAVLVDVDQFRRLVGIEAEGAPKGRLSDFLRFSEQIRQAGGGQIAITRRRPRRSPLRDVAGR